MKALLRRVASNLGYEVTKKSDPRREFRSDEYLRHNARRLEHLASLALPLAGNRVLDLGAGIGDHAGFYLDRGCSVTAAEARPENLAVLSTRFPNVPTVRLDMETPQPVAGSPFDVIHCYGLLYHLRNPQAALEFVNAHCGRMLLLETCVSFGAEKAINLLAEPQANPTQAVSGMGCRPTRGWVFAELQRHFAYVYIPKTQPNHREFPLDWTAPEKHRALSGLQRSVFIASRTPLAHDGLCEHLLDVQIRQP